MKMLLIEKEDIQDIRLSRWLYLYLIKHTAIAAAAAKMITMTTTMMIATLGPSLPDINKECKTYEYDKMSE
jgi:hypothetical protein